MAKKTHVKVRLVPEAKPDSPFFYYVKKPSGGEKAKVKLKNGGEVRRIARGCGKVMSDRRKKTKFS